MASAAALAPVRASTYIQTMGKALYDRLGGEVAVMAAVEILYAKLLADPLTRPFFAQLDIAALTEKQVAFLTWAFGGPPQHRGRPLREAHANLVATRGLDDAHFDAVAGHLASTLAELGVAADDAAEVMTIVGSVRAEVLGR